jgi:hypothetical protein
MSDIGDVEFIKSQLTLARWHLEQASAPNPDGVSNHLDEARRAYETAVNLLPTLKISGTRRVEVVTGLAGLRNRLLAAGIDV